MHENIFPCEVLHGAGTGTGIIDHVLNKVVDPEQLLGLARSALVRRLRI